MTKLFYLLIVPGIRFLINFNHFLYLRTALIKQREFFVSKSPSNKNDEKIQKLGKKAGEWVQANQLEIKKRVLNAGISDHLESYMKPKGFGYTQQQDFSALDNLLFMNKELMQISIEILNRAKGSYKVQAMLSFSLLFWIELIIFLPRELFKMAGVENESKSYHNIVNGIQLIYWIISIVYMAKKILI